MKEIKFRAWTGRGMEYDIIVGKLGAFYAPGLDPKDSACISPFNTIYSKETPIMQFTGLKDKNGKAIFEGDIVRVQSQYETDEPIDSAPNKVYFHDGAFRCGFHNMILGENVCTGKNGNWNMEVIGNIYENPEWIEVKK